MCVRASTKAHSRAAPSLSRRRTNHPHTLKVILPTGFIQSTPELQNSRSMQVATRARIRTHYNDQRTTLRYKCHRKTMQDCKMYTGKPLDTQQKHNIATHHYLDTNLHRHGSKNLPTQQALRSSFPSPPSSTVLKLAYIPRICPIVFPLFLQTSQWLRTHLSEGSCSLGKESFC